MTCLLSQRAGVAALGLLAVAGCSQPASVTAATAPVSAVAGATARVVGPQVSSTLAPSQVSDPGLPSQLGPGPLRPTDLPKLVQYFEDHVAQAYAAGTPDELYRYLAGPMLTGNRATVTLLGGRGQRNIFKIVPGPLTVDNNDKARVVVDVTLDETLNYYTDVAHHQVLNNGLPGPAQLSQQLFFDYNPANHTWYWTGEQDTTKSNPNGPRPVP